MRLEESVKKDSDSLPVRFFKGIRSNIGENSALKGLLGVDVKLSLRDVRVGRIVATVG